MIELECVRVLRGCDTIADCRVENCPFAQYGDDCRRNLTLASADCIENLLLDNQRIVAELRKEQEQNKQLISDGYCVETRTFYMKDYDSWRDYNGEPMH